MKQYRIQTGCILQQFSSTERVCFQILAPSMQRTERGSAIKNTSLVEYSVGKKILVVEDEEVIRRVCAAVLDRNGFEYIIATNGAEGLEAYRDRYEDICLVLSDVSMPVKDGIQMFREILALDAHANVILMSGYAVSEVVPEDLKRLCSLLTKPFTAARLIESVRKCLQYDDDHKAHAAHWG